MSMSDTPSARVEEVAYQIAKIAHGTPYADYVSSVRGHDWDSYVAAAGRIINETLPLRPSGSGGADLAAAEARAEKLLAEGVEWRDMYRRAADERDRLLRDIHRGRAEDVARPLPAFARHILRPGHVGGLPRDPSDEVTQVLWVVDKPARTGSSTQVSTRGETFADLVDGGEAETDLPSAVATEVMCLPFTAGGTEDEHGDRYGAIQEAVGRVLARPEFSNLAEPCERLALSESRLETALAALAALGVRIGLLSSSASAEDGPYLFAAVDAYLSTTNHPDCGPAYGVVDPDYARIFTIARCVAWSEGYALLLHGSFTRDLDLLAVPWEDRASDPEHLVRRIVDALDGMSILVKDPEASSQSSVKPHGRLAWTLTFDAFADPRFVDVSVMPRLDKSGAAS